MKLNNKRGISLIVLVITIIVMIILAAAIILSLSSAGIIGKANEAKTSSDNANLLEAANLASAEWELEKHLNKHDDAVGYITTKLKTQGFTQEQIDATLDISADGKVSLKDGEQGEDEESWDNSQEYLFIIEDGVLTGVKEEYRDGNVDEGWTVYADKEHTQQITEIIVPEGVTSIGDGAFSTFSNLTSVAFPVGLNSIGKYAFAECRALTSVSIPEGVTSIGEDSFSSCDGLTSITLPKSLISVGWNAFGEAFSKDVYYAGSQEEWNLITFIEKNGYNDTLKYATIHYNS